MTNAQPTRSCLFNTTGYFPRVSTAHLTEAVLALPETERLALAREIIASLATDEDQKTAIGEGVRRMEDIIKGQTTGLTESQFRAALR